MRLKRTAMMIVIATGLAMLMSTTCAKEEDNEQANCTGVASATVSGNESGTFCFDLTTTFTYEPNSYVTLWARESASDIGFDVKLTSVNSAPLATGTYSCAPGEPGFVELIIESNSNNEFYKSQSGTLTVTQVNESSFKGSFNVVCVGYYNGKSINFSGTFNK